jgi:hypothetical protein
MAVTFAKHGKVPTLVAYDSGNLLSVATALEESPPDRADLNTSRCTWMELVRCGISLSNPGDLR